MTTIRWMLVGLGLVASTAQGKSWYLHPKWNEGLAEVALMEGKQRRYGAMRDLSVDAITVREYFDPHRLVKTQPAEGKPTLAVMKLSLHRRFRTGIYEYVQMSSAFVDRQREVLVKLTTVSSEWCGNSSVVATRDPDGNIILRISNYMDDQGLTEHRLGRGEAPMFREQFILFLRNNLDQLQIGQSFELARSLTSNNPMLVSDRTKINRIQRSDDGVHIVLSFRRGIETFSFADDELHTWIGWKNDRGEYLRLRKVMFLDYWNRNQPGDEKLLE